MKVFMISSIFLVITALAFDAIRTNIASKATNTVELKNQTKHLSPDVIYVPEDNPKSKVPQQLLEELETPPTSNL